MGIFSSVLLWRTFLTESAVGLPPALPFGIVLLVIEAFIRFWYFGITGLVAVIISIILSAASAAYGIYILLISSYCRNWKLLSFKYLQRKGALKFCTCLISH